MNRRTIVGTICTGLLFLTLLTPTWPLDQTKQAQELEKRLQSATGKEKVDLLNEWGELSLTTDLQRAQTCATTASSLAEQLNYQKGKGYSTLLLAQVFQEQQKTMLAIDYAQRAYFCFNQAEDSVGKFLARYHLGRSYLKNNDYDKTLTCLLDVIQQERHFPRYPEQYILSFIKLAITHRRLGNPQKAMDFIKQGLLWAEKAKDPVNIARLYNQAGIIAKEKKDFTTALDLYQKALQFYSQAHYNLGVATEDLNIGNILAELHQYAPAVQHLTQALAAFQSLHDQINSINTLICLGKIYTEKKQLETANSYYQQALVMSNEIGEYDRQNVYWSYAHFSYQSGHYREAYDALQTFLELQNKLFSREKDKQINNLQEYYDSKRREQRIELLERDRRIAKISRNSLLFLLASVLLVLGLVIKRYFYLFTFWKKQKYIGQYRIQELIGQGGMGIVYKGHPLKDKNTTVAIKVLRDELSQMQQHIQRFKREGMIIDRLNHPHILKIHERGEQANRLYIIMEYLQGKTLDQMLSDSPSPAIATCSIIMIQICDALEQIHDRGIVHCDLKAQNIMVCPTSENPYYIKLLDFGLAKISHHSRLTTIGMIMGTLSHIPPENFQNISASPASDIYSLGIVFYQLLTGCVPYQEDSVSTLVEKILHDTPSQANELRPDIPEALNTLLLKMLAKDPQARPSAADVKSCLLLQTQTNRDQLHSKS